MKAGWTMTRVRQNPTIRTTLLNSEDCHFHQCTNCRHLKASDISSDGINVEIQDAATSSM